MQRSQNLIYLILRSCASLLLSAFAILGAQHHLAAGQLLAGKTPQGQQCLGDGNQMKSWPIKYISNTNTSQMQIEEIPLKSRTDN